LPSSISVVGLPTKTTYREGDPINKSGIVVKAYLADGTLYDYKNYQFGAIPLSELEIEPTKASGGGGDGIYNVSSAGTMMFDIKCTGWPLERQIRKKYDGKAYYVLIHINSGDWNVPLIISLNYESKINEYRDLYNSGWGNWTDDSNYNVKFNYNGKTYVCNNGAALHGSFEYGYPDVYNSYATLNEALNDIIPKIDSGEADSGLRVTVKWKRPEDGKELTDTFKITVIPANTSGGESGEGDTGEGNTTGGGGGGSW